MTELQQGTVDKDALASRLEEAFEREQRFLSGLLYRMTGSSADAADLFQDTFARTLEHPPARLDEPLRPWLVRVAINLARDHLRKRKRSPSVGVWLPSPIETGNESSPPAFEVDLGTGLSTEARYDLLESVTLAFLLALEALTPAQRAVLLLRDVFDYSVKETAEALDMSEPNVKTTHHRARKALDPYNQRRVVPTAARQEATSRALFDLFTRLMVQDVEGIEALLAEDVRSVSDGGGEYHAALRPILGKRKVGIFFRKLTQKRKMPTWYEVQYLNGFPAMVIELAPFKEKEANRLVIAVEVDRNGRIREVHSILAPRKLTAVRFG